VSVSAQIAQFGTALTSRHVGQAANHIGGYLCAHCQPAARHGARAGTGGGRPVRGL